MAKAASSLPSRHPSALDNGKPGNNPVSFVVAADADYVVDPAESDITARKGMHLAVSSEHVAVKVGPDRLCPPPPRF